MGRTSLAASFDSEGQEAACRVAVRTGRLRSLDERCGYTRCGPFGAYAEDPNSVFMHKVARP
jgi:putative acetyltransferase